MLPHRRPRAAGAARGAARRWSARWPSAPRERPAGSYTVELLDDPHADRRQGPGGGRGGRARRARGGRRPRRRGGRRRPVPPGRAAAQPRARARRRRGGARWPPPLSAPTAARRARRWTRSRELARDHNLIPLRHTFIDDCETPVSAFLKLRGRHAGAPGLPAGVGRAGPARRALVVHRRAPAARCCAGRWATAATPTRSPRDAVARAPPGPARPTLPPFAGGAVGFFGYDLVRTVEPLGRPEPRRRRPARHRAHALRRAGGLRPPQAHRHDPGQRLRRRRARPGGVLRRRRRDDRQGAAAARRPAAAAARRRPPAGGRTFRSNLPRGAVRGDGRADRRVRPRRRRLPGRALAALERGARPRPVLALPRPARRQPEPVHVLPGLPGLPGRGRVARAAADGDRAPRLHAADRRARARAAPTRPRTPASPRACSPTRRSAPST